MIQLLTQDESNELRDFIYNKKNRKGTYPYKNMHVRGTGQKNKKTVLKWLIILKAFKVGDPIKAYLCGKGGIEIEYEIRASGKVRITNYEGFNSLGEAYEFLPKTKRKTLDRLKEAAKPVDFAPKRSTGEYYLERQVGGGNRSKIYDVNNPHSSVKDGVISQEFYERLNEWDFKIYQE